MSNPPRRRRQRTTDEAWSRGEVMPPNPDSPALGQVPDDTLSRSLAAERPATFIPSEVATSFGWVVVPATGLLGLAESIGRISRPVGFGLCIFLCLCGILLCMYFGGAGLFGREMGLFGGLSASSRMLDMPLGFLLGSTALLLVAFSQVCRGWYLTGDGFRADETGYWHWVRFGVQNSLQGGLFDLAEVFEWRFSEISATSTESRSIIFAYRLLFEAIVISTALKVVKIVIRTRGWEYHNRVFDLDFGEQLVISVQQTIRVAVWLVPLGAVLWASVEDDVSPRAVWEHATTIAAATVTTWLGTTSLRIALRGGRLSKVAAALGLAASAWLVRAVVLD